MPWHLLKIHYLLSPWNSVVAVISCSLTDCPKMLWLKTIIFFFVFFLWKGLGQDGAASLCFMVSAGVAQEVKDVPLKGSPTWLNVGWAGWECWSIGFPAWCLWGGWGHLTSNMELRTLKRENTKSQELPLRFRFRHCSVTSTIFYVRTVTETTKIPREGDKDYLCVRDVTDLRPP